MSGTGKDLDEGGAKERDANGDDTDRNPALQKENRQAAKNQSSVKPEDYPDRGETPVGKPDTRTSAKSKKNGVRNER